MESPSDCLRFPNQKQLQEFSMSATSNPKRTFTQSFACRGKRCGLPADFLWEARCAAVLSSCTRVYGTSGIRLTDRFLQVVEKVGDKKYFFLCFELFGFSDRRFGFVLPRPELVPDTANGKCSLLLAAILVMECEPAAAFSNVS